MNPETDIEPGTSLLLGRGSGPVIEIDETRVCVVDGCTNEVRVHAKGPDDSILISWARKSLKIEAVCDPCADQAEREEQEAEERERRERRRVERVGRSGIPVRWRDVRLDQVKRDDRADAIDAARAWATQDKPKGLLLYGKPGRGKSLLAAVAAATICERSNVRWISVADLQVKMRLGFDAPEYAAAVRSLMPPPDPSMPFPALVLDDLDKTNPSEHSLTPMFSVVNAWVEANAKLIITTNRNLDDLERWMGDTFGEAMMSRIAGHCQPHEVRSKDWRTG